MDALVFDKKTLKLTYVENRPLPKITKENDVLLKVAFAGFCGTDLSMLEGLFPCCDRPFVIGHEICGTIVECGKLSSFKIGQRVAINPGRGCNRCRLCHTGKYHLCYKGGIFDYLGLSENGGFAEYCLVPDSQIIELPVNVTLEQASLCEPISCIAHGLDKLSPLHIGERILIVGAGIIGNLFASILHLQGHRDVTVVEISQTRLEIARNMDLNFKYATAAEFYKSDLLFDVIIDCSGVAKAFDVYFEHLDHGAKYLVFGVAPKDAIGKMNIFDMVKKELTVVGSIINPFVLPHAVGLISSLGERYLNFDKLGIKVFKLCQYKEALEVLNSGNASKIVFKSEKN